MYALIENQRVIGVFDENDLIANNSWQTVVPIDTDIFVWLECGEVVTGKISNIDGWIFESDTYNYDLSEIQSWQPIGTWLSF